jgi:hypothetical protein
LRANQFTASVDNVVGKPVRDVARAPSLLASAPVAQTSSTRKSLPIKHLLEDDRAVTRVVAVAPRLRALWSS